MPFFVCLITAPEPMPAAANKFKEFAQVGKDSYKKHFAIKHSPSPEMQGNSIVAEALADLA